jgi:tRNA A-37 threonylcarbamoyl transferase component Bud32/tetratricopeptide (TPR) repeat protein
MRSVVEEVFNEVADLSVEARVRYFEERGINEETRREVESLLAFDTQSANSLDRNIMQAAQDTLARLEPQGRNCGAYRLGELIGRGGMGSVYSAERVDGEVVQRVAVKLLRPGVDDPASRQRFLSERQILASLSHPHIARLLDAGHGEDGQPYLVMEYIEGQNIDAYASGLSLRQKAALFVKVCSAVSYLHRNLVVHRDLKPSNILVTVEGEPKLLDFGIAKMLDLSTDSTVTGLRMLTPDYASPEQVNGGSITTATDIYSLGAVLYKMLTGASPHKAEGDSAGALAFVTAGGKITAPSKLQSDVKGDLEAILLKALRRAPQERYVSVEQLSDDLESYLESRPIRARKGDAWYRTRKFLRRHWLPVAASAAAVASLAGGVVLANHERDAAERRFSQLRQLSNKVLDLDVQIRTLPGSMEARKRLVAVSLEYLEGLSREAQRNVDLAQETASGYVRLARIQGVNEEFNLGDLASADESLKKANALITFVLKARGNDRTAWFRAAAIAHDRMIIASSEDRRADVVVHARELVKCIEAFMPPGGLQGPIPAAGSVKNDTKQRDQLYASAYYVNTALEFNYVGMYSDAALYARRALDLAQAAGSPTFASQSGMALTDALRYQGDLDGAQAEIQRAWKFSEQVTYSSEVERVFYLYGLMRTQGSLLGDPDGISLGRWTEAIDVFQRALNITEEGARKDPNETASRTRLGEVATLLGDLLRDSDPRRALAVYDLGIRRLGEAGSSIEARRERADLLVKSSYALRHLHEFAQAKTRIEQAGAILRDTHDYPAERIRLDDSRAYVLLSGLADQEATDGNLSRSLEIYDELLRKVLRWPPEPEKNLQDALRLSRLYAAIATLDRRADRLDRATDLESRRQQLWKHWDTKLPHNGFVRIQLEAANTQKSSSH